MNASDNPEPDRVASFAGADERARRLRLEVERLARLPTVEWMFYVESAGYAEKYGVDKATLKHMVEAVIKENEKKEREKRQIEARGEKEKERKADKKERLDRQVKKDETKKAEKKERERQKALATIVKLPRSEHEATLQELSRRLDEDLDGLREELALLLADAETAKVRAAGEPWPEPVDGKELLDETEAQLRRYVVIHDEAAGTIYTLTVPFAWVHDEIATFSPILLVEGADSDVAKTLFCQIHSLLTPRARMIVKPTGPALYRLVDHAHPSLYIDNGDKLLAHDSDLADITNSSWMRGIRIPRVVEGKAYEFDPFCFKVINGIDLLSHLDPATRTRCIATEMLPKLPDEKVIHVKHAASDERFAVLRRKWLRWSNDNMAALRDAEPAMPEGFNNRLAENYALLFAIADLAGGDWPKRMRAAAIKLSHEYNLPSLRRRLLAKFFDYFIAHGVPSAHGSLLLISKQVEGLVAAEGDEAFSDYLGRGRPITQWQIAGLLKPFKCGPELIHPRGRTERGYDSGRFETPFKHYLGKTLPVGRSTVRTGKDKGGSKGKR